MLTDDQHGIHRQLFLSDSQGLSNGGVDLETKLLLSLPAQVALRKLST